MLQVYFSGCLNQKNCSGGRSAEVAPAFRVIKKLKIESSVAPHALSHSMLQRGLDVIK